MKRDIKAGALIKLDMRTTFVGSTPYYPNRGRGQGSRGSAIQGRQGNQGRALKIHRSWSPDSKKVGGNNITCQQWRPKTPPEDATLDNNTTVSYADVKAQADPRKNEHHAPAATPNGNMSKFSTTTVSLPTPKNNVNVSIDADTNTDQNTTWSNLFKESLRKLLNFNILNLIQNRGT